MDEFLDIDNDEIEQLAKDAANDEDEKLKRLLFNQKQTIDTLLDGTETPDEVRTKARKFALSNLDTALKVISEMMVSAEKDATRLSAARTIWHIASSTSNKDDSDPIADLFEQINKKADSK